MLIFLLFLNLLYIFFLYNYSNYFHLFFILSIFFMDTHRIFPFHYSLFLASAKIIKINNYYCSLKNFTVLYYWQRKICEQPFQSFLVHLPGKSAPVVK